jgi:hypothetical protein
MSYVRINETVCTNFFKNRVQHELHCLNAQAGHAVFRCCMIGTVEGLAGVIHDYLALGKVGFFPIDLPPSSGSTPVAAQISGC